MVRGAIRDVRELSSGQGGGLCPRVLHGPVSVPGRGEGWLEK